MFRVHPQHNAFRIAFYGFKSNKNIVTVTTLSCDNYFYYLFPVEVVEAVELGVHLFDTVYLFQTSFGFSQHAFSFA